MTTFADQVYQMGGMPVGGLFMPGKSFFVRPSTGSDGNTGRKPTKAFQTLAKALSMATANNGDVVYLIAESNTAGSTTDYQSVTLDWNKDGVHLVGINDSSKLGQRSRIAQLSTVKSIDTLFKLSANNCLIQNLEIFQGVASSTAVTPVAMQITGQRNHVVNCQISGNGDTGGSTDVAAAASLVLTGAENLLEDCYIGLDTVIRTTQAAEIKLAATGLSAARNTFKNCMISTYTSTTAFLPVTVNAAMDRFTLFDNCLFYCAANISSAAAPAGVFGGSLSTINGVILLKNPMTNCTQYAAADASRVVALGHNGLATGHLIGIAQAIDAT